MRKPIILLAACILLTACGELSDQTVETSETILQTTILSEFTTAVTAEDVAQLNVSPMYQNIFYQMASKMGEISYSDAKDTLKKYSDKYEISYLFEDFNTPAITVTDPEYSNNKIFINFYCEEESGGTPMLTSTAFDYIGGAYEITVLDNFHDGGGVRYQVYCMGFPDEKIRSYDTLEDCERLVFGQEMSHDIIE